MSFDFETLAQKAFGEGGTPEANDDLWAAMYSLETWHFLMPPGKNPASPTFYRAIARKTDDFGIYRPRIVDKMR